jgi:hypothetical protein
MRRTPLLLLTSLVLLVVPIAISSETDAPRPLRVIATGKASGMPIARGWILVEPSLEGTIVPTRESGSVTMNDVVRLMRMYFPRTFDELISYDFLLLAQVSMGYISPRQAQWMYDGIADHGLGGANTRSVMSMNNYQSIPWAESIISEAFPNDAWAVIMSPHYVGPGGPLVVNDDESLPPVMRPFKTEIERLFPAYGGLLTVPRRGSRIHSWLKTDLIGYAYPRPGYIPHLFEWDYQEGRTFTIMDMLYDAFWRTDVNSFALDIMVNVIWRGSDRPLPQDAMQVHVLRDKLRNLVREKLVVLSIFDFAEKSGANTAGAYRELEDLQGRKSEVDGMYLTGEFDLAFSAAEELSVDLGALAERAVRLKDQAMAWVYAIEWLAVTSTLLVCGMVVWGLMIRRRLYREAGSTRLEKALDQGV